MTVRLLVTAFVAAAVLLAMAAPRASADSVTSRVPLALDRTDRGNSSAAWDEVQRVLRQRRDHSDARFATSGTVLGPTGVTGNANCGGSTLGAAAIVNRTLVTADLNGDGLRDIVLGCPGVSGAPGRVLLVRRSTGNAGWDAPQWLAGLPNVANDKCGQSVDAGDFDGDGKVDLIVGCPTLNVTGANSGGVLTFRRTTVNVGYDAPVQQVTAGGGGKVAIGASETCGAGVAAGDVDHDGDADVVFGCQSYSTDRGRTIVQTGSGAQTALLGTGSGAGDYTHQCGGTLIVRDVNGDGDGDILVGCHGSVVGGGWGGAVLVYNSNGAGGYLAPIKLDRGGSAGTNHYCGRSLSVGDLDGDGREDIAMGCTGADRVVVFWNPPSPGTHGAFTSAAVTTLTPPISGQCGAGVVIGDVTGDGRNDLAIGCPTYNSNRGATLAWARLADGSGFAATPMQYDRPTAPTNATCGQTVAVGDVDRDGRGQLLFGCGTDDAFTTGSDNGAVVVTAGTVSARVVQSAVPGTADGCGLATASGDFNADGIGDVATGCWTRGGTEQGRVSVVTRTSGDQTLGASVDVAHPAPNSYDKCGHDIAVADVNGDNNDDLVVGCPGDRANGNQSGSFVVFERNAGGTAFLTGVEYIVPGTGVNDQCGWSIAAGDINRDGRADIAVGCIDDELGTTDSGLVAVYLRAENNAGFEAPDRYTRASAATNDQCGISVAIGDVDGDGYGDLAFGCGNVSGGFGGVSVHVFDPASETFGTGAFLSGGGTADWCGNDIAIGDVDADGRGDLLVGCQGAGGIARSGAAFVVTRNVTNTGFDTPTWIIDASVGTNEYCGAGVSLGDVNGDGRDDVAMGCPFIGTTATAGSIVVATRNAANNGFDGAVVVDHPSYVAQTSNCGQSVTLADIDADGRSDLIAGCQAYSPASDYRTANYAGTTKQGGTLLATSIADGLVDAASTTITTTSLNLVPGRVTGVTVTGASFTNGAAALPAVRASADGGATWENVAIGVPHAFVANGTDLRLEFVLPPGVGGRMTQLINDLVLSYDLQAPPDSGLMGQRVSLSIDRSDVAGSTAQWDEVQQSLRQARAYSAARFSTTTQLQRGTPGGTQYCGWSSETGDVNDDGLADVVMGCAANNGSVLHAIVYVRSGSSYLAPVELPTPALHGGSCCGDIPDSCAYSLAVGDVNADGKDDVVMGCPGKNGPGNDSGAAVLFLRNVANTNFDTGVVYNYPAGTANDQCGYDVALGDVNQDGYADLAMACPNSNVGATEAGLVVVRPWDPMGGVFGAAQLVQNPSPAVDDACGISVAIGDVDADGRGDVATGCLTDDTAGANAGSVVVYRRNVANTGFVLEAEYLHPSGAAGDNCGNSVGLADLDGNGRADLVFSCPIDDVGVADTGTLVARWRNGANTGFTAGDVMFDPEQLASDQCGGWNGFAVGDVSGDGRPDVALGCNTRDIAGANSGGAFVHVANDTGTGFVGSYEVRTPVQTAGDQCGISVAIAPDESGDGRGDLLFGCPADSTTAGSAGSLFVLDAAATMTDVSNPVPSNSDACGQSVDSGDVNGDGLTDLVVGCSINATGQGGTQTVSVYVRSPGNTGYLPAVELVHPTPATDDLCGVSVAVGDVNGDGRDDVMGGCPYDDTGGASAGSVVLWMRNASNTGFRSGVEYGHPTPSANAICGGTVNSGYAVASGDINGDGRADLVFGCAGQTVGGFANAGVVVVRVRNASNSGFATPVVLPNPSPAANEYCGTSVDVGDLDGDGRADIAAGCWGSATNAGSVAVWTSDAGGGFTAQPELAHPSAAASDNCGVSIDIGDVDGNGLGDVATGCRGDTVGAFANAGSAVVFPRLALNTGFDTGVVLTHPTAAASDVCGYGVSVGDVNGDGKDDVALGCPGDQATVAGQGSALTFARNAANTGFDPATVTTSLQPAGSDQCGYSVTLVDLDQEGRSDIAMGCPLDDGSNTNQGSVQTSGSTSTGSAGGSSRLLETRLLNTRTTGTVTTAHIGYFRIANGAAAPTFQASADGGANWQAATPFVPLAFTNPGNDLRLRITLPASGNQRLVQVLHDLVVNYDYTGNAAPGSPNHVSPAAAGHVTDDTPALTATFNDADPGDTGTLQFEVCTVTVAPAQTCAGQGGTQSATGSTAAGIANGANGTWSPASSLTADSTYYWRVRASDAAGVLGTWSASRSVVVDSVITVGPASSTIPLGSVSLGGDAVGSTTITVGSNDPQGYQLVAADQDAAWGMQCSNVPMCATSTIPDRTATGAAPLTWAAGVAGTSGYTGVTVRDTTGVSTNRLAKWGTANIAGWPEADFGNNLFVGLGTTTTVLHQVASVAPADTVVLSARVTAGGSSTPTPAGTYAGTITVTAVGL